MGKQARVRSERAAQKLRQPYVIGLRVELTFDKEETDALLRFQKVINSSGSVMSIEQLCKQAVFFSVNESYARAAALDKEAKLRLQEKTNGKSESGNTEGNTEAPQLGTDVASDLLAETSVDAIHSERNS